KNTRKDQVPGFCEVRYSWYVERHHTLKHHTERKRVVQQMNELIKEHLDLGYVMRVDYRTVKELENDADYIIRYYPGQFAQVSTARIRSHLGRLKNPEAVQLPFPIEPPPTVKAQKATTTLTVEEESLVRRLCEV